MGNRFKVGDKVVRTKGHHTLITGDEYTISWANNDGEVRVEGYGRDLMDWAFSLATPKFKPMKFRVKNEEHSKAIQTYLFGLGYMWGGGCTAVTTFTHTLDIYTQGDGYLWRGTCEMPLQDCPEYTLDYEVETTYKVTNVEEVVKKELVTIGDKTYDRAVLEKALSGLEEAQQ